MSLVKRETRKWGKTSNWLRKHLPTKGLLVSDKDKDRNLACTITEQRQSAANDVASTTHPSHTEWEVVCRYWARFRCPICGSKGKCRDRVMGVDLALIKQSEYWPKGGLWSDGQIGGTSRGDTGTNRARATQSGKRQDTVGADSHE